MKYGETKFNAVGRVNQETVDLEVRKLTSKHGGKLSDLDVAIKLMLNIGYRIEWHHLGDNPWLAAEGVVWQADVHPPAGV